MSDQVDKSTKLGDIHYKVDVKDTKDSTVTPILEIKDVGTKIKQNSENVDVPGKTQDSEKTSDKSVSLKESSSLEETAGTKASIQYALSKDVFVALLESAEGECIDISNKSHVLDAMKAWHNSLDCELKHFTEGLDGVDSKLCSELQAILTSCDDHIKSKCSSKAIFAALRENAQKCMKRLQDKYLQQFKDSTNGSEMDSTSISVKNGDAVVPREKLSEDDEEQDIDVLKQNGEKNAKQDEVIEKKEDELEPGAGVQGFGRFAGFEFNKEQGPTDFFEKLEKFGENESIYVEAGGACESVNNTVDCSQKRKLSTVDYAKLCEIAVESYVEGRCKDLKCTGDGMELDGERQLYMQETNVYLGENYCFQPVRVQHVLLLSFLNATNLIKNEACINSIASHLKLKNVELDKFLKSSSYDNLLLNEMNGTNGMKLNSIESNEMSLGLTQPGTTFGAFTGFETNLASNGNLDDFFDKVGAKEPPQFGHSDGVRNEMIAQQTHESVGRSGKNVKNEKDKNKDAVVAELKKALNQECGEYPKNFGHKRKQMSGDKFPSQAALEALTGVTQDGNENESEEPSEGHMSDAEGNGPNVTPRSPLSKKSKRSVKNE